MFTLDGLTMAAAGNTVRCVPLMDSPSRTHE